MALNLVAAPWTSYAIGRRWVRLPAVSAAGNMATNAVVSFLLVRNIGFDGALYGSITGNVVGLAVFYVLLRRRSRARWLSPALRPTLVCAIIGGVAALVVARTPGLGTSWPAFLLTSAALAVVLAAGLVAVMPRALRAEARGALRRRGAAPEAG
jgi:peptidoglycan biosynthesis protein MviN/MurJ (putative lipid II flippase)